MPKPYGREAIDMCMDLYCKYGGVNHEAIEAEMQKVYPGWRKHNLYDRGRGKGARLGWITKHGFENALRLSLERRATAVNNDEQDLYIGIKTIRKQLQVEAMGSGADKDIRREFREYAKIEIEARRNLDLSRDNLETFVSGYEKLIDWLGQLNDPAAVKMLLKHGPRLIEMAQSHYGEAEAVNDGTGPGADESGERPGSGQGVVG